MGTVYKWVKVIGLGALALVAWTVQGGLAAIKLAWRVVKYITPRMLLALSYVFFFLPTLILRMVGKGRKTKERRHRETLAAIRGEATPEADPAPIFGKPWLLDQLKAALADL